MSHNDSSETLSHSTIQAQEGQASKCVYICLCY